MNMKKTKAELVTDLETAYTRISDLEQIISRLGPSKTSTKQNQPDPENQISPIESIQLESDLRFRALIANAADLIMVIDAQAKVTFVSPSSKRILGFSPEEMIGADFRDHIHPEDLPKVNRSFEHRKQTAGTAPASHNVRIRHKNGEWRVVDALGTNMMDEPSVRGIVLNVRDVTDQEQADNALTESENRFSAVFHSSPAAQIISSLPGGKILDVNKAYCDLLGYEQNELIGRTSVELGIWVHPEEREEVVRRLSIRENVRHLETDFRSRSGAIYRLKASFEPIELKGQSCIIGTAINITEQEQTRHLIAVQRDLARLVGSSKSPEAAWKECLDMILNITGLDSGGIYQFDQSDGSLKLVHHSGLANEFIQVVREYKKGSANTELALAGKIAYFTEKDLASRDHHKLESLRSMVMIPIQHHGQVWGCLNAASHTQPEIADFSRTALETLGDEIGNAFIHLGMEEMLRESEARYHHILDSMMEGCQIIDFNWRYAYVNDVVARQGQRKREELLGRTMMEAYPGIENTEMFAGLKRCMEGGELIRMENEFRFPNGSKGWFELSIQPAREGIFILSTDITERKLAEESLRRSEERFSKIFLSNPMAIILTHLSDGKIVNANRAFLNMFDYKLGDVIGTTTLELNLYANPIEREKFSAFLLEKGKLEGYEIRLCNRSGKFKDVLVSADELDLDNERYLLKMMVDITERRAMEAALQKQGDLLLEAQRLGRIGHFEWDRNNETMECSDELYEIFGIPHGSPISQRTIGAMMIPEDLLMLQQQDKQAFQNHGDVNYQYRIRLNDGSERWLHQIGRMTYDESGKPLHMMGVVQDITDQKRILKQLEDLAKFPSENPGPVMRVDVSTGKLLYANEASYSMLSEWKLNTGQPAPSLLQNVIGLVVQSGRDKMIETIHEGQVISLEFILNQAGRYVNIYGRNITEQKHAQEKLRESENRAHAMLDAIPDLMFRLDSQGIFLDYKADIHDLYRQDVSSIIGLRNRDISPVWFADLIEQKIRETLLSGKTQTFEYQLPIPSRGNRDYEARMAPSGKNEVLAVMRDITERKTMERELRQINERFTELAENLSDIFWVSEPKTRKNLYISPAFQKIMGISTESVKQLPNAYLDLVLPEDQHILQKERDLEDSGFKTDTKYRIRRPDGTIRWVHDKGTPVFDESGKVVRVVGIASDITDQVESEERVKESEMRFQQIAETIPEIFWVFDNIQQRFTYVSPAFEDIWGGSLLDLYEDKDLYLKAVLPDDHHILITAIEKQAQGEETEMQYRIIQPDGSLRWVHDRSFPIMDERTGTVLRTIGIAADITDRKSAEEQLRQREADLAEAQRVAQLGNWHFDFTTHMATWSDELYNIFEVDKSEFINNDVSFIALVHPDDRNHVAAIYEHAKKTGEDLEVEYRVLTRDGADKYVREIGFAIKNEAGQVTSMFGITQDITVQKKARIELQKRASQLTLINDVGREIAKVLDIQGVLNLSAELVHKSFGYHHVGLFTLDHDTNELVMRSKAGKYAHLFPDQHRVKLGAGIVGTAAAKGQMVLANRVTENPSYVNYFPEVLDTVSELGLPIKLAGLVIGVLDAQSPEANAFDANDIQVLQTLADQVAVAIENARLYGKLQSELEERKQAEKERQSLIHDLGERVKELTALHQASRILQNTSISESEVLNALVSILPSAWQYPEVTEARIILGKDEYATANFTQTPWIQKSTFDLSDGRTGSIEVAYLKECPQEDEGPFLKEEQALLETLAERLQTALTRRSMEFALRKQTEDLTRLLEAGRALSETFDPQLIYPLVYQYISVAMPCDFLIISSFDPKTEMIKCEYLHSSEGSQDVSEFPLIPLEPPGKGTQSLVIRSGRSMLMSNYEQVLKSASNRRIFNEKGEFVEELPEDPDETKSAIIVPLKVNGAVSGALQVFSNKVNGHTQNHLQFVEALAFHLSSALSNARLFAELEERVRQRTIEVQDLYDKAPAGYHSIDADGKILLVNQTELKWLGFERDEMVGHSILEFLTADSILTFKNNFPAFKQSGYLRDLEMEFICKDGSTLPVLVNATAVYDENGNYIMSRSAILDNSERQKAEVALRESEQQNRLLFDETPEAVVLFDLTGRVVRMNRAFESFTGLPGGQFAGHYVTELGLLPAELMDGLSILTASGQQKVNNLASLEYKLKHVSGELRDISTRVFALKLQGRLHYLASMHDITTSKRAEETLRAANTEMERALRLKDEFLANMSHELRTPLNAILGISESLLEQLSGPLNEKQQKYLQTVLESAQHLLELINDILDLAKINAGRVEMEFSKVDVTSVANSSLRMIRELAQKKGVETSLEVDKTIKMIMADERRLKQMLVNLLSNAVKFTPKGGKIGLDIHSDTNILRFTVWDTGIGIEPENIRLLFKPFVQLDGGLTRGSQGTGLGLVLVSQMARLHGGSVSVESEPGKGSRFTISIPWTPAGQTASLGKASPPPTAQPTDMNKKSHPHFSEGQKSLILLVEDTEAVTMLIGDYLELHGYQVVTAKDGFEGIALAKEHTPDLILMDVMMPEMDGTETTKRIRNELGLTHVPIIALTALAMSGDRERCLEAGMNDYLSKPVTLTDLLAMVKKYINNGEAS